MWGMAVSLGEAELGEERPAHRRALSLVSGSASTRRTLLAGVLHILLVWTVVLLIIEDNYGRAVESWKTSAKNIALTVAAHAAQTQGAADLVVKSMVDWIAEERIETEQQFRQVMGEKRFFDDMRDRILSQPQIGIALIVAANGDVVNATRAWPPAAVNVAQRDSFRIAVEPGAMALSGTSTGVITGHPRFYIARKIVSANGELLGVVGVGLEANFFAAFYKRVALGPDSSLALFRSDGTLLATSLPDQELGARFDRTLPQRLIEAGESGKAVLAYGSFPSYAGGSPASIVVATKLEGFPAYVTVAVGESTFLAVWHDRNLLIVGIGILLTVLTVLAGVLMVRLIERSSAAAREASERQVLAAIVDTPSAMTAVVDRHGKVVHANSLFRHLLGTGPDRAVADALFNPALEGVEPLLTFINGKVPTAEINLGLLQPGDRTRRLRFSLSRQSLPDSGESVILVGHDETLRHQAERAIALSGKLVTLGEITTGIAHELSQPLNVIRMAAQNALAEADSESPAAAAGDEDTEEPIPAMSDREFREFASAKLTRIVTQVDRAAAVISRMRIFSRSTREGSQSFDLRDACRGAIALVAQPYRTAGIALRQELGEEPLVVVGHRPLIEQALVAVLGNARDALSDAAHSDKVVKVSAERSDDGHLRVRIADNGPGIPEEIRERIFEPFFTTKPEGQGTGLGLAVAYGILRDAGGSLTLEPSGAGAIFQIDLPGNMSSGSQVW
jgi:signal transduction histidine kinase